MTRRHFRKSLERTSGIATSKRPDSSRSVTELHRMGTGHRAVLDGSAFLLPYGGLRRGKLLQWRTAAIGFQDSPAKPSTM